MCRPASAPVFTPLSRLDVAIISLIVEVSCSKAPNRLLASLAATSFKFIPCQRERRMNTLWSRSLIPTNNLWMDITKRSMSKYLSKAATKRVPLTSKRARKGYYKGNGSTKEGHITSKAKFIVDRSKQVELIVPDLTGFKVRCC